MLNNNQNTLNWHLTSSTRKILCNKENYKYYIFEPASKKMTFFQTVEYFRRKNLQRQLNDEKLFFIHNDKIFCIKTLRYTGVDYSTSIFAYDFTDI